MPEGFPEALADVLRFSHELRTLEYRSDANPLDTLAEAFDLDLRSARSLVEDPRASGKAVLLTGLNAAGALIWDATMRAFSSGAAKRTAYAASVLVTASPAEAAVLKDTGASLHLWRGVVSRSDALLMALSALDHSGQPLLDRLAVETAVALRGWDLHGVVQEAGRRARSVAALFDVPNGGTGLPNQPQWENGLCDLFDGNAFVRLEACHPHELRRRIWRAQVSVLFGWLEEIRLAFVERVAPGLKIGSVDPSNWEWSELSQRLHGSAPGEERDFAECCRRLRNRLAHRHPVAREDFTDVLQRAEQLALTTKL
jgi:hypothetical protein